MLRRLLSAVGISSQQSPAAESSGPKPYEDSAANQIYDLIFCDDAESFAPRDGQTPTEWQKVLFTRPANFDALTALAADPLQESRVRYLATQKLKVEGQPVQTKQLFGVVVEMLLDGGLDTLAAYLDGSVRYINHTGKMTIAEPGAGLDEHVRHLFAVAQPVVNAIGPWGKPRRPPPSLGNIRLSFLVSDGLCFGEGGFQVMQREPMAAPLIAQATALLQAVVAKGAR